MVLKRFLAPLIAGLIVITTCLFPLNASALIGLDVGDTPRDIVLTDLEGKGVNASASFGKKPVIIVFWELSIDKSFINYSLDELLFLNDIYEKYKSAYGLEIFAIYTPEEDKGVSEEELRKVKNIRKINKIKYPILIDSGFRAFRDYGVIALPSTVMVEKSGKVKFIYPSFPLTARPVFAEEIRELLGFIAEKKEKHQEKKGDHSQSVRLYRYALQMFKKGLFEQALSPLKKSIILDPSYFRSHNLMGIILWNKGDFDGAISEFKSSIDLDVSNIFARFNYALLLMENEQFSEAEDMLQKTLKMDNSLAAAHYALGLLYEKTDKTDSAMKELKIAFDLFEKTKPEHGYEIDDLSAFNRISILYILSGLHNRQGNAEQTLDLLHKAAEIALGLDSRHERGYLQRSKELLIYE